MTIHISGAVLTHHGIASNNRGENEGNITTLQKLLWHDEVHTTVSSEAIRWAIRYRWQVEGLDVRRRWNDEDDKYDETSNFDAEAFIDDDLMGFMLAKGATAEGGVESAVDEDAEGEPTGKSRKKPRAKKPQGTTTKRRGVLEIARAISLTPYAGDITFNAKAGEKGKTSLYGSEVHATHYQFGFCMTPARLKKPERAQRALDAIVALGEVAGNHSRFLYDFSPESLAIRISHDPSPRLLYCFETRDGAIDAPKLLRAVTVGDIAPSELIVGGALADTATGAALKVAGVTVIASVRQVGQLAQARLKEALS